MDNKSPFPRGAFLPQVMFCFVRGGVLALVMCKPAVYQCERSICFVRILSEQHVAMRGCETNYSGANICEASYTSRFK